jgi:hypothetical protein
MQDSWEIPLEAGESCAETDSQVNRPLAFSPTLCALGLHSRLSKPHPDPMSLLPPQASFEELVQDCYLAYRGAGLMLSPLDQELLTAWAGLGVPFEVVARGIRQAAEAALFDARPGEPALRSLRSCRRAVEGQIKRHLGRSAGAGEEPAPKPTVPAFIKRLRKLRGLIADLAAEQPQLQLARVQALLERELADSHELDQVEEQLEVLLVRALPFADRISLLREAQQLAQNGPSLSAHARKRSRRFHRSALLRRFLSMPFW